jgi:ribosome biogenesis GTPase
MAPKFKGDSEDWLDQEARESGASRKRKPAKNDRAKDLDPAEANATVAEVFPNQCRIRLDTDSSEFLASYRRATVIKHAHTDEAIRERSPVAVGDRVCAQRTSPQSGVIEGTCQRRNSLSRPAPGRENKKFQHVIAANVDDLVIVTSAAEPLFSPGMVDRYLVAASAAGIRAVIVLNKIDLKPETAELPTDLYQRIGYEIFHTSSKKNLGLDPLRKRLEGKAAVFCGQSGVGKTSLLRNLLGREIGKIGDVSEATGKGRHTTTAAVLLAGSSWIDTPGVREFGLAEIAPENLAAHFPEFASARCSHASCRHLEEEGCTVRDLPRYASYRRIYESLVAGEN